MQVALSDLKLNVGKYVDLSDTEEVVITRYGKPAAKIVRFDRVPWHMKKIPDKVTDIEQLFGTLPSDVDIDEARAERLMK